MAGHGKSVAGAGGSDGAGPSDGVIPEPCSLSLEERVALIMSVGEEVTTAEELEELLSSKTRPRAYDGFEPSGRMHIAQGLLRSINTNKLTQAGCEFVFWVADWFAMLNNKMGGDLNKIRTVGKYMIEVWRACGMDMTNVKFLWCSDTINARSNEYWTLVMNINRAFTISRLKRCGQIMGRADGDDQPAAQLSYAAMQCADIFFLGADICQLGIDQRKVNVLAREAADKLGFKKPVVVSHHMVAGLTGEKMSKSIKGSAIFMEDTSEDVHKKIKSAFCEPGNIENNPILDYCKTIIYEVPRTVTINDVEYATYPELEAAFAEQVIHPSELKPAVANIIDALIEPVREHFRKDPVARNLLEQVQSFKITR